MIFNRIWAMPNSDTFDIPPIGEFVKKYLRQSKISIDPFARNKRWATYTNDLNPDTAAEWHCDSADFLEMLVGQGIIADLVIFDPPYSPRQIKECYDSIGIKMQTEDAWRTNGWTRERKAIDRLLGINGIVLSFGWNSNGIGQYYGMKQEEILLICHGWGHNDTICLAERKIGYQLELF